MAIKKTRSSHATFYDHIDDYSTFQGQVIPSSDINLYDFSNLNVSIIGTDQHTISALSQLTSHAKQVNVFQFSPQYILPKSDKQLHRLINHPLLIKNKRLFNQRIKSLLSLRFIELEIQDEWLRHLVTPNRAQLPKNFLKSDDYYAALQHENCTLATWPVLKIKPFSVCSLDGFCYKTDIIIRSDEKS